MIQIHIVFSLLVINVQLLQDSVLHLHQAMHVAPVQIQLDVEEMQTQTHIVKLRRLDLVHPQLMDFVHFLLESMLVKNALIVVIVVVTHVHLPKIVIVLMVSVKKMLLIIVVSLVKMNTTVEIQTQQTHTV